MITLAALGCGDDTAGSADVSSTGALPGTSTGPGPTTGDDPTPTTSSATDSGATGTASATTSGTTTTEVTTGAIDATTGGETTTTTTTADTTTTTTSETSSSETSPPPEVCTDGITCDGDTAIICIGGVESEEQCIDLCLDGIGCGGCLLPMTEVCDGLDNNCDGVADEGGICGAGSCGGGGGGCIELPIPPLQPLVSGCRQQFPPAAGLPCPVPERGPQFHVSATTGDDGNDGATPATAWASLCHAISAAPAGSTLRVAEGAYAPASVYIDKSLILKGGWDTSFAEWDPDAHPTMFHGRLHLDHNDAVFGGFRMISSPLLADAWSYGHHFVGAGTLVRNYIEIVATAGADPDLLNLYGIIPSACPGGVSVLRCNDIYVRSSAPQGFVVSAVEYGNQALHAGQGVLDSNRICQDGGGSATDAVGGYGSCFPEPTKLLMRNNIIEKAGPGGGGSAINFYSCGVADMDFTLTNNTILSSGDGVHASGDPAVMMRWKLSNNVVWGTAGGQSAIDLGLGGVELASSEGNLTFGFQSNAILPAPLISSGDDTTGIATPATVFVDANAGDLHPAPNGPAVATGLNVYGLPVYGTVTTDVAQAPRSPNGSWDRGAYKQ